MTCTLKVHVTRWTCRIEDESGNRGIMLNFYRYKPGRACRLVLWPCKELPGGDYVISADEYVDAIIKSLLEEGEGHANFVYALVRWLREVDDVVGCGLVGLLFARAEEAGLDWLLEEALKLALG